MVAEGIVPTNGNIYFENLYILPWFPRKVSISKSYFIWPTMLWVTLLLQPKSVTRLMGSDLFHGIIEWFGSKSTLRIILFQPPAVFSKPYPIGLEHFQGWGIHNSSGQPVPSFQQPGNWTSFSCFNFMELFAWSSHNVPGAEGCSRPSHHVENDGDFHKVEWEMLFKASSFVPGPKGAHRQIFQMCSSIRFLIANTSLQRWTVQGADVAPGAASLAVLNACFMPSSARYGDWGRVAVTQNEKQGWG